MKANFVFVFMQIQKLETMLLSLMAVKPLRHFHKQIAYIFVYTSTYPSGYTFEYTSVYTSAYTSA